MSDISQFLIPKGFRFGATKAGLKASGRTDFALIVADAPASAAAAFTGNRVKAAPVLVGQENLSATGGKVRVVAINAGNANCAAGQAGMDAARATCEAAARIFGCSPQQVIPCSTGIIGVPLPAEKLIAALPGLAAQIGRESDHFQQVAEAISPLISVEKTAFAEVELGGAADTDCRHVQGLGHDPPATGAARDDAGVYPDGCQAAPEVLDGLFAPRDRGEL